MNSHRQLLISILSGIFLGLVIGPDLFAAVNIPGKDILTGPSIDMNIPGGTFEEKTQNLGWKVLELAKLIVSGLALIYLVMIGAYMITFSENEERIKTQRKQIIYAMIGFLFLNIPGIILKAFYGDNKNTIIVGQDPIWSDTTSSNFFWDSYGFDGILGDLIAFLQVFVFWAAILTFTWWLFMMVVSGGDEEKQKNAKHRITYGVLALIFMAFVKAWGSIVAAGDVTKGFVTGTGKLFSVALFFAGPMAIFFLIWGAYYYITSGGDEERVKKWKAIIVNTFIATLILLAAYSFLADLVTFTV